MDTKKIHNWIQTCTALIIAVSFGTLIHYVTTTDTSITKETLAVASAKCAYNGTTLHDVTTNRFSGLENLKSALTRNGTDFSVTCDNGAMFKFEAKWKDPLTEPVKTSTITAPEKK